LLAAIDKENSTVTYPLAHARGSVASAEVFCKKIENLTPERQSLESYAASGGGLPK
jgi:hypothetical protein